ncbi:MAG: nitroreductase family protein [Candidatus Methanoperedenaceae archaeon]|nr:nitroreductase family protein [Candidatus Methanoperedenaceae archaeon]
MLYIVLSIDADDMDKWYARLEAGFVARNMLLQGSAMGVGCWFTTGLGDDEKQQVREVAGIEKDVPLAIVSLGYDN